MLIAGAGPAGASLALAVTATGPWRVILVDRPVRSFRQGETLPGAARALLRDLGVLQQFESDLHARSLGLASLWGSDRLERRDAFADPHGPGWRLDRPRFERGLLDEAVRRGCRLVRPAAVTGLERDTHSRPWLVRIQAASGEPEEVRCRFVVDASGRRASLARRLGVRQLRVDNLVCDTLVLPPAAATDLDGFSIVEAAPNGWFYATGLQSGARLIAFHTDFDLAERGLRDPPAFLATIAGSRLLHRFAPDRAACGPVSRVAAWGGRLARCTGPGWAAVGDAACCLDPLSSQGVFNALYGGLRLGQAIATGLRAGTERAIDGYAGEIESVWAAYRRHSRSYYAAETRWAARPFWRRRAESGPALP